MRSSLSVASALLWLAWVVVAPPAGAQETWKLEVSGTYMGRAQSGQGAVTTTSNASGSVELKGDSKGNYSGAGVLSVRTSISYPPQTPIQISPLTGKGSFTVTARRDGKNLVLRIEPGAIPCRGTMTILLPTGRETQPFENSFDPSSLASPGGVIIERRPGATAESNVNVTATGVDARGGARFVLGGGTNVTAEPAPRSEDLSTDHWTLEFELDMVQELHSAQIDTVTTTRGRGSLQFLLPRKDGPAKGQGPFTTEIDSTVTRPMANKGRWNTNGDMVLDGTIKDGVLTFTPRLTMKDSAGGQTFGNVSGRTGYNAGASLSEGAGPVSIRVQDGAETVQNQNLTLPGGMTSKAKMVWRLRGKKTELWRITLDCGWRVARGGTPVRSPKPRSVTDPAAPPFKWTDAAYGLKVRANVVIDVEIEDGKYKRGTGRCALVSQTPYCQPPGIYDIQPAALPGPYPGKVMTPYTTHPSFTVKNGTKYGQQLELDLYSPKFDPIAFWVGYQGVLNEKEAEKQIAFWKESRKASMPRTVSGTEPLTVPFRISVMLQDGWKSTTPGADSGEFEALSVQRIR